MADGVGKGQGHSTITFTVTAPRRSRSRAAGQIWLADLYLWPDSDGDGAPCDGCMTM